MSQKTHPIGFRIGVTPSYNINTQKKDQSNLKKSNTIIQSYSNKDLHGLTSRWATSNSGSVHKYSNYIYRDQLIKNIVEELIEEEGYLINKIIINRSSSYVGIYVDGYELEEPIYNFQANRETNSLSNAQALNCKDLEAYISQYIENNTPVYIQFVKLEISNTQNKVTAIDNTRKVNDLQKVIQRLTKDNIPCCSLLAKLLALKRNQGGRQERETVRLVTKLLQNSVSAKTTERKLSSEKTNSNSESNNYGLKGYLLRFKGRIGGSERSRIVRYRFGPLPRHTVSAAIDYGFSEVNSVSGKISVTVMAYFK